ncbi:uncharacterized protein TOT_020000432 [Theileria orientalis strain Shintoku]|uniref:Palmitoyltransferase n=1 Tax=Theileria orientalis strain Shintoku TaxID=869250 RepID=J4D7G2_THEOR|nr:uncharacterized protein TOT_020000432 [Theileria orientalis strain Shintoku]PVC51842.1 hypothetical protein MACL_00001256 [Theileria orientalis]BAM40170.1 uncharacterized protein TOT_020000432 [Theileria orientalis strain Shintoku]|eukprot:XP_009690471.1 uncharacterized protein TOT_020000432 [Theileria orientalis strain Shintoku]
MDSETDNIIIDEQFVDTEKNDLDSYRIQTRRTESYSSYVPNRIIGGEKDTDPLLTNKDRKSSSKTCFRSPHSKNVSGNKRSVLQYFPVVFVTFLYSVMYGTFFMYHLKPEINQDLAHYGVLSDGVIIQNFVTHLILLLLITSYVLCIIKNPGGIPDTLEWSLSNRDINTTCVLYETKKSGARRVCKWCSMFKPDRTHHCRTCGRCVLKMDHHCPWANNCIGWRNHKYFYLTILYSDVFSVYIAVLLFPTMRHVLSNSTMSFDEVMLILATEVISIFLSVVLTCFLLFHTWLICENFTTIEFCEKYSGKMMQMEVSIWSDGLYGNLKSVLGKNPLLWLIPYDDREGDGISFRKGEKGRESIDDSDQTVATENSVFMKIARDSRQFDPEIGEESP